MFKLLQPGGEYHQCCTVLWTHSPKPQEHNFSPGKCLRLTKHKSLWGCYNFLENQRSHMEPVLWFFKSTGQGWELVLWFLENYYWSNSPKIKEIVFTQPYRFGSVYEKERGLHNNGEYPSLLATVMSFFKVPNNNSQWMPKSFDRMGLAGNFECNVCVQWKRKCRYGLEQRWLPLQNSR